MSDPISPTTWQSLTGRDVEAHAPIGSFAARKMEAELHAADAVVSELRRLLSPAEDVETEPIDLFLIDPSIDPVKVTGPDEAEDGLILGGYTIVRIMQPEEPLEPISLPLARLLIARWFGPYAASAEVIVEGIAGVVAARTRTGPPVLEAHEWVQEELDAGRPVSVLSRRHSPNDSALPPLSGDSESVASSACCDPAATSFVDHLLSGFGPAALRKYLSSYDPDRHDHAAMAAFSQTLGVLEEAWLAGMKRRTRKGVDDAFRKLLRQMMPLLRPYRWRQMEIFILSALSAVLNTFPLALGTKEVLTILKKAGDAPSEPLFFQRLVPLLGLMLLLFAIEAVASLRRAYAVAWLNQHVLNELQLRMFKHLQSLPHGFFERAKLGDLMSRLTGDLDNVQSALSQLTNKGLYQVCLFIAAAGALITAAPNLWLNLSVLAIVPIFALTYVGMRNRNKQASREQRRRVAQTTTTTQEVLSGHQVVKAFGMEETVIRRYRTRLDAQRQSKLRLAILNGIADLSEDLTTQLAQIIVFLVGGFVLLVTVDHSGVSAAALIAAMTTVNKLFKPVAALSTIGQTVQQAVGSMERVNELFEEPVTIADKPGAVELPPLSNAIELRSVTFGYGTGREVLKNLSLRIEAGTSVALVGPSGCGKSTLVSLLLRFWDPEKGQVLFDAKDLRDVSLTSLRAQIGYVFQDTFVFDDTIRANIAIGRPDATDTEIAVATRAARLEGFIESLPNGYETVLGERGVRMSGGQRQRLAIARAILRDPAVLILDEATSALDAKTEAEILETLSELAKHRTTISVTHRLSWAARADRIFVLKKGQVVEEGTHLELIQRNGLYKRLYEEQTGFVTAGPAAEETQRLREVPLFSRLDDDALEHLAKRLRREQRGPGEAIFRQGDRGDRLYIIGQGRAEVVVADRTGERRIALLRNGEFFGEMGLLTDSPRMATVRTLAPTQLYSLSKQDFDALMRDQAPIRDAVTETVSARSAVLASAGRRGERALSVER